jgi:hypothetical protein
MYNEGILEKISIYLDIIENDSFSDNSDSVLDGMVENEANNNLFFMEYLNYVYQDY